MWLQVVYTEKNYRKPLETRHLSVLSRYERHREKTTCGMHPEHQWRSFNNWGSDIKKWKSLDSKTLHKHSVKPKSIQVTHTETRCPQVVKHPGTMAQCWLNLLLWTQQKQRKIQTLISETRPSHPDNTKEGDTFTVSPQCHVEPSLSGGANTRRSNYVLHQNVSRVKEGATSDRALTLKPTFSILWVWGYVF